MAFIGMRHVVVAKVATHSAGSEPTYSAGMVAGKAITGNLTINRNNNPLYADDVIAEDDNGITSMELELGLDDMMEDVQEYLGLIEKKTVGTGTDAVTTYYDTDKSGNDVGVGYIRVRRKNGETKFQALWIYNALFSIESENSQTKGETIEWNTPTANGRCKGLDVDGSGDRKFRKRQLFDTESAAATWLDGLAQISVSGNG
jgi:hypothetical protein